MKILNKFYIKNFLQPQLIYSGKCLLYIDIFIIIYFSIEAPFNSSGSILAGKYPQICLMAHVN